MNVRIQQYQALVPSSSTPNNGHTDHLDMLIKLLFNKMRFSFEITDTIKRMADQSMAFLEYCQLISPNMARLCGKIHVKESVSISTTFNIATLKGTFMKIMFEMIRTLYSPQCQINRIILKKAASLENQAMYCGEMPPWEEVCLCNKVQFVLMISHPKPSTDVKMSYTVKRIPVHTQYVDINLVETGSSRWLIINIGSMQNTSHRASLYIHTHQWKLVHFSTIDAGKFQTYDSFKFG